ncbi:Hsp33 family molecular chaperone HslO [Thermosipho ferrireducens]|uniref:33 kDa chaperonin n=1 Tax=Thermosipho ferrireducens TaxID=2571116 RepID=A0ABX7S623_9BACT|nr:Hsp33 family molecular chaperone HslO [Thermosipho ferrireducens]QTA37190.1 Hsp33 family molecular chaperone HslO [Thermosipho ferrireducens]
MTRLHYGTAYNANVRFSVINSTELVKETIRKHNLSLLPAIALGRAITGVSLVLPWLSINETWTLLIEGKGVLKKIASQVRASGRVRGYVIPKNLELPPEHKFNSLKEVIGKGTLKVIRDLGLKNPYISSVPLKTGEIAEDLAYYFTISEQIPTAISLGLSFDESGNITNSGGLIIQILNGSIDDKIVTEIEKRFTKINPITKALYENSPIEVLKYVFENNLEEVLTTEVSFSCDCTQSKAINSLKVLPEKELNFLIQKGEAEVICKWCNTKYTFKKDELRKILNEKQEEKL